VKALANITAMEFDGLGSFLFAADEKVGVSFFEATV
jgi:hypothetical protein